jgi:hypothetical protein
MDTGSLSVLNVGAGDIEVRFNPHQPEEMNRALKMLKDMQQRGYAILVRQDDGSYARAVAIDASTHCYIVAGAPDEEVAAAPVEPPIEDVIASPKRRGRPKGKKNLTKQPIAGREAVAVARSAGG